ncbi:MAG TPA: gephyrin-like molybdotransferase Glp [Candidatus Methylacidiphilales bacterium]|nr:gephyrin-like molybdotransferase Glp [Candidatus Methylacidiphilales bacterium]
MISVFEAQNIIRSHAHPLQPEQVALSAALGRTLREPAVADADLPAFDRSAMDGYAIASQDSSTHYRIAATIQPGQISDITLKYGETARIFTGAAIPAGADCVIPQELTETGDSGISFTSRPTVSYVRKRGEDSRAGDVLIQAGKILQPSDLGILASTGQAWPAVTQKPRVLHLVSGNELVEPEQIPLPGQIRDSNSALITALVNKAGGTVVAQIKLADDEASALHGARLLAPGSFDILLFSGGASVGAYDFCASTLRTLGFLSHFRQVNVRPGKPLIFASRGHQLAFGIPGNPVSHFAVFHLFIRLALVRMQGAATEAIQLKEGHLMSPLADEPNARETYWPASWSVTSEGKVGITPLAWNSSGHLSSLSNANALLRVPANSPTIPAGERVQWVMV